MPQTVIYDANVLYPNTLRDLLIRVSRAGLVHARWTDKILDEMSDALRSTRVDISEDKLLRLRGLMNAAVRDCLVTGYEDRVESVALPDKDDRHVVAAAITAAATLIVTWNIRDFPADILAGHGIEVQTPDDFVSDLIKLSRSTVWSCVQQIADARLRRPQTAVDILAQLERDGLVRSTAELVTEPPA
jgi:predicted nucleic acid-binding protein